MGRLANEITAAISRCLPEGVNFAEALSVQIVLDAAPAGYIMENYPDLLLFPRLSQTDNFEGADLFIEALYMDIFLDTHRDVDVYMEMIFTYWDAFLEGNIAASVNLLRVFMMIQVNTWKDGDSAERDTLLGKYLAISNYLTSHGHPIIPYYDALACILMSEDKEAGWDMMVRLACEGNEYAVTLCAWQINREEA